MGIDRMLCILMTHPPRRWRGTGFRRSARKTAHRALFFVVQTLTGSIHFSYTNKKDSKTNWNLLVWSGQWESTVCFAY